MPIGEWITDYIVGRIKHYLRKLVVKALKILLLTIIGMVLLAAGAVFFLIGTIQYLSHFMPSWLAWDVVGLVALLLGGILLLLLYIQFKSLASGK